MDEVSQEKCISGWNGQIVRKSESKVENEWKRADRKMGRKPKKTDVACKG